MMTEINNKKIFKKHSIVFVFFQIILIGFSVILFLIRGVDIGIPNFSMLKLFYVILACTILFGIFVSGYLLFGLGRYKIVTTYFVEKINYKILMILLAIIMVIGAGSFFTNLYLVGGVLSATTWGGLILGIAGLTIFGITLIIGTLLIINKVKAEV